MDETVIAARRAGIQILGYGLASMESKDTLFTIMDRIHTDSQVTALNRRRV